MSRRWATVVLVALTYSSVPGNAGELGAADRPDPPTLVETLGAGRYQDREAASQALEALGPRALPALRAARDHPDAEVRRRADGLVQRIEVAWMIDVREVLAWLPPDTESIVVARGPFPTDATRRAGVAPILEFFRLQACGFGLSTRARLDRLLPDGPIRLAVEGARRFRGRIGPLPESYEGGHVLLYRDRLDGDASLALEGALARAASRVEDLDGWPVAVFEEAPVPTRFGGVQRVRPGQAPTLFVTQARPDTVVIATDRAYLAELLGRLKRAGDPESLDLAGRAAIDAEEAVGDTEIRAGVEDSGPDRALSDDLPEWAHVEPAAPAWALRHFADDPDDATSPRNWPAAGKSYRRDPGAVGLVARVSAEGEAVEVRYLTTNPAAPAAVGPFWTARATSADVSTEGPGVVAIHLPTDDARQAVYTWFTLATALGHPPLPNW